MSHQTDRERPHDKVIEIDSLAVRYGQLTALDGVSLEVMPGAVFALVGRNGAGKSSLVRCLLGHRRPSGGRVALFGRDSWQHRRRLMARLGVVPEEPDAPPSMTASRLGRFCSRLYPTWDAGGYHGRLKRFDVPLDTAFAQLSKGQKAQVQLSLALASSPRLLVLDDPTLGLDAVARKAVYEELVVELADRDLTVFITSHDLRGMESIATRIGVLAAGKLVVDEPLETLKGRFRRLMLDRVEGLGERRDDGTDLLEGLAPLEVRSRGRGAEALVSRYDEAAFERLRTSPEVAGADAYPVALEEIVIALTEFDGESMGERREVR